MTLTFRQSCGCVFGVTIHLELNQVDESMEYKTTAVLCQTHLREETLTCFYEYKKKRTEQYDWSISNVKNLLGLVGDNALTTWTE